MSLAKTRRDVDLKIRLPSETVRTVGVLNIVIIVNLSQYLRRHTHTLSTDGSDSSHTDGACATAGLSEQVTGRQTGHRQVWELRSPERPQRSTTHTQQHSQQFLSPQELSSLWQIHFLRADLRGEGGREGCSGLL